MSPFLSLFLFPFLFPSSPHQLTISNLQSPISYIQIPNYLSFNQSTNQQINKSYINSFIHSFNKQTNKQILRLILSFNIFYFILLYFITSHYISLLPIHLFILPISPHLSISHPSTHPSNFQPLLKSPTPN